LFQLETKPGIWSSIAEINSTDAVVKAPVGTAVVATPLTVVGAAKPKLITSETTSVIVNVFLLPSNV